MSLAMVWAQSADGFIGVDGSLPWHLPEDLAHFRSLTAGSVVLMGHATWRSLPTRFRPLPGRVNVVLSRRAGLVLEGAVVVADVQGALDLVGERDGWVIGGGQVYEALLGHADRAEVTEVDVVVGAGTPAPRLDRSWVTESVDPDVGWAVSSTGLRYRFLSRRRGGRPGHDAEGRR